MKKNILTLIGSCLLVLVATSCDDFLDITPTGKVIAKTAAEYRALLTYEYKTMPEDRGIATLRADEMTLDRASTTAEDYNSFFDIWAWNDLAPQATTTSFGWRRYYHAIYIANYIIEHQNEIAEGTADEISQLVGEAFALRAYMHFLLVNLYAEPYTACAPTSTRGVPVQIAPDVESIPTCSSVETVYQQVLADLDEADKRLNVEKWDDGFNYRFTTVAARALRARVALYKGDWQAARTAAESVIAQRSELEDLTQKSSLLPDNYKSVENILALEQVMTAVYKAVGRPSNDLLAIYKSGDQRKSKYFKQVTASVSTLQKGGGGDSRCSFRTAEMYLIAAEAAAQLGDTKTAVEHLTTLMQKRYSASTINGNVEPLATMTADELLAEIAHERRCELAFEGHRWFDLRRTTRPQLQKTYDGQTYTLNADDSRYTLRFPVEAVEANPNLENW
ncbi:MAG: RagB/SusD family nutrient uptake outer membrane protein [Prevotella sp.]|nr:RagB/SusD family nutrient uptake outer membrane protein [Prevotella sp.]